MINITFTGNIYHSDGTPAEDVKYQGLFIKKNPNSSNTVWDVPRSSEANQYNFNLGDNSWLSQQGGYVAPFDKVVLCFWLPETLDRTDTSNTFTEDGFDIFQEDGTIVTQEVNDGTLDYLLTEDGSSVLQEDGVIISQEGIFVPSVDGTGLSEWAFIEWILDGSDVYVQNIQLQGHNNPTCSFDISGSNPLFLHDTGTTNINQWLFEDKEHYQAQYWDGEEIFLVDRLDGGVTINWGDTTTTTYPLSSSPFEHFYLFPNDYIIETLVSNVNGLTCSSEFIHRVYDVVENGLEWLPTIYLNESVRYTPNITGDLRAILGVDYYLDGVLIHENFAYNQYFDLTLTVAVNHILKQCIRYDDGFDIQTQCVDFTVELSTHASYVLFPYDCGSVFTENSNVGAPPIVNYQWDVTEGAFLLSHVEGLEYGDWYYAWPYAGTFQVRMAITDSNGRVFSVTKEYIINTCMGGDGGGSSPWVYAETKFVKTDQPLPIIKIVDVEGVEGVEDKKILIIELMDNII